MTGVSTDSGSQLIVIGASAGGIEALSRLVANLPSDLPAAVVLAQHLDPKRSSHLAEILERHTTLPLKVVDGTTALADGVIYVVPPNRLVEVGEDGLRLRRPKRGRSRRRSTSCSRVPPWSMASDSPP